MELMKLRPLIVLIILLLTCSACSSQLVKGQAPLVSVSLIAMTDGALSTRFDIRNINDVEMVVDAVDITLRVRDADFMRYDSALNLTIGPNATEEARIELPATEYARDLLIALENGEQISLPFLLDGKVHTRDDGFLKFRYDGHIYPMPGRPGQFRSATTSSRNER